jgi:RNA polymerase sigma factor (sigma-70 family)
MARLTGRASVVVAARDYCRGEPQRTSGEAVGLANQTQNPGSDLSPGRDRDPFERLVADHQDRVARLVYRLLGWRGDVDDIVQDVFLAAFKRLDSFREDSSPWTWLAAIAINRCRTYWRRKLLEFRWLKLARPDSMSVTQSNLELDETAQRVRQAMAALPAHDREVIVLYYLEDWCVADISRTLGASPAAIDVRLHRAREKLRKMLGDSPE